jgi:hypothetical protein
MYVVFHFQINEDYFPISLCLQVVSNCGQVITEEVMWIKPREYHKKHIDEEHDGNCRSVSILTALKYLFAYTTEDAVYVTVGKRICIKTMMVSIAYLYLANKMTSDESEYMFKQLAYLMVNIHCLSTNALTYVGLPSTKKHQLFAYPTLLDLCNRFHIECRNEPHPLKYVSLISQCYFVGRGLGVYWF